MRSRKYRVWAAILLALVLAVGTTSAVYAYLSANSGQVSNTLTPETPVTPSITNDYKVNVGDSGYAVYVRAVVVATWRDSSGNVYAADPGYTFTPGTDWFAHGGFYYYRNKVDSNGITSALITNPNNPTKDGYTLHVEVIAQTIQALGTTDGNNPIPAVQDAWKVYVDADGKLTATPPN